jgi:hypothetical protein
MSESYIMTEADGALSVPCHIQGPDAIRHYSNEVTWTWHLKRDSVFSNYLRRHDANLQDAVNEAYEVSFIDALRFLVDRLKRLEQPCKESFTTAEDPELALALSETIIEPTFARGHLVHVVQSSFHKIKHVKRVCRIEYLQ